MKRQQVKVKKKKFLRPFNIYECWFKTNLNNNNNNNKDEDVDDDDDDNDTMPRWQW